VSKTLKVNGRGPRPKEPNGSIVNVQSFAQSPVLN